MEYSKPSHANHSTVSLMFSGGVDSTHTALILAEQYKNIHLLSYENGYGNYHISRTNKRAKELHKFYPNVFSHSIISIQYLFDRLVASTVVEDYKKYKSGFIWCMGCKIAMHTQSIIYNVINNIHAMTDGSSKDTEEMVEQMQPSLSKIKMFYKKYDIDFFVPAYNVSRNDKRSQLKDLKFHMGIPVRDRYLGIQPTCHPGELYYLPYLLFNKALAHDSDVVIDYIENKQRMAETIIEEQIRHVTNN